jgi:hypothetical protein
VIEMRAGEDHARRPKSPSTATSGRLSGRASPDDPSAARLRQRQNGVIANE